MKVKALIVIYLGAIIVANLVAARFGPSITIFTAFLFIGLDFSTRDFLHNKWERDKLWVRMAVLISVGSVISYLVNRDAGPIALASFIAFALASIVDTITYSVLHRYSWIIKVNGSNILSSAVDSVAFPTIAFGSLLWPIVIGQFVAKILGGFIWGIMLKYVMARNPK